MSGEREDGGVGGDGGGLGQSCDGNVGKRETGDLSVVDGQGGECDG